MQLRRNTEFVGYDIPLVNDERWNFERMWKAGWFDDYCEDHFLIRALKGDDKLYYHVFQYCRSVTQYGNSSYAFAENFCVNFIMKLQRMIKLFGVNEMKGFIKNQLAAGKKKYREEKFFEALSEVEVLLFFGTFGPGEPSSVYEPRCGNGNCNPEASFVYPTGHKIHIEVKTPEFVRSKTYETDVYMPLMPLNDTGISEFERVCREDGCVFQRPRLSKLKSFLDSAITKFHVPDNREYNILCINWSYTDIIVNGYIEPVMLLFNKVNGIINHKDMAKKLGISPDIYEKISAVLVFQNSVEAITMMDLRYLWAGYPRSAVLLLNPFVIDSKEKAKDLYDITQIREKDFEMNFEMPIYFDTTTDGPNEKVADELLDIMKKYAL